MFLFHKTQVQKLEDDLRSKRLKVFTEGGRTLTCKPFQENHSKTDKNKAVLLGRGEQFSHQSFLRPLRHVLLRSTIRKLLS